MNDDRLAARMDGLRAPARLAYLGILLLATLSHVRLDLDPVAVAERVRLVFQPDLSLRDVVDGVRNVALFAGWGLVWTVTAAPGRSRTALRNAVLTGAGISLVVEAVQLLTETRIASLLDVVTNAAGAFLGALLLVSTTRGLSRVAGRRSVAGVPAAMFAICYGAAVAGEAVAPLFRQGGVGDFILFLPAGVFGVAALQESGRSHRSAGVVVGLGALAFFSFLELVRGIGGSSIHVGSALVQVTAIWVGAWLAAIRLPSFIRGADRTRLARLLTVMYVAVLAVWTLRPFAPEANLAFVLEKLLAPWWMPLQFLGVRSGIVGMVDLLVPFLLFVPLGGLLAVWPLRLTGRLAGFAPAIYLAGATELSQFVLSDQLPDISIFMIKATAVTVGWTVARRSGLRANGPQLGSARAETGPSPPIDR